MSKLAESLSGVTPAPAERSRRGPAGACDGRYPADLDAWREVERIRREPGSSWQAAQRIVDAKLGLTTRVLNDKFRYHWRRKCQCWDAEDRL